MTLQERQPRPTRQTARLTVGTGIVDLDRHVLVRSDGEESLSELEVSLLAHLLRAEGQPVSRHELLRQVWGYRSTVRSRSVDHVVKRLRAKIEVDRKRPVHLLTVHHVGYRLVAEIVRERQGAFFGRVSELGELQARLSKPGVLTVLGPGGMGKTALARQALERRRGTVWVAELDGITHIDQAWAVLFRTLGTRDMPGHGAALVDRIVDLLSGRGPGVLFLDGTEGVATDLTPGLQRLSSQAPHITVLLTSRVRTQLGEGEYVLELGPLAHRDAVDLLWARTRAVRPDLSEQLPSMGGVLSELADRLDCIPLAIELAAARSNLLSPSQLLAHLTDRMGLLAGSERTLQSTLDSSWDLCTPVERTTLVQLTAFRGGFQVEDAQHVVDLPSHAPPLLDVLQSLRDQSWLRAWTPHGSDALRLGMYEAILDYLRARAADLVGAQERHAQVFARYGAASSAMSARRDPQLRRRYGLELSNLFAGLDVALQRHRVDLAVPLWRALRTWLHHRGPFALALTYAESLFQLGLTPADESIVRQLAVELHRLQGEPDTAEKWARRAVELAEELGDPHLTGTSRNVLGSLLVARGKLDEAERCLMDAWHDVDGTDANRTQASIQNDLGTLHKNRGRMAAAQHAYWTAHGLAQRTGDQLLLANISNSLAIVSRALGDYDEAMVHYRAAITAFDLMESSSGYPLMNLANLHARLGDLDAAIEGYRDALEQARNQGNLALEAAITSNQGAVFLLRGDLDQANEALLQALPLHRQRTNRRLEVATLLTLADVALARHQPARATRRLTQALQIADDAGLALHARKAHLGLARAAVAAQQLDDAQQHLDAATAAAFPDQPAEQARLCCIQGIVACAKGELETAQAALTEALTVAPEEATQPRSEIGSLIQELRRCLQADSAT